MYGGNAYGSAPYAGGASGAAAPVEVTIPAGMLGRLRSGSAEVSLDVPVAAVPAGLVSAAEMRYDKALAYPTPTLVNGRPT